MPKNRYITEDICPGCGKKTILYHISIPGKYGHTSLCKGCLWSLSQEANRGRNQIKSYLEQREAETLTDDPDYARIVQKFFTPYEFLAQYWTGGQIISACARHAPVSALTQEYKSETGRCPYPGAEFLRRSQEYLPQYDRSGREYLERKRAMCDVYRIGNQYQGLTHGKVILDLLYGTWPELMEFQFEAYEIHSQENYEIYPKGMHIYVPLKAILEQDTAPITERCLSYAKSYNYGAWTPEETRKRLDGEPAKHLFKTIQSLKPLGKPKAQESEGESHV